MYQVIGVGNEALLVDGDDILLRTSSYEPYSIIEYVAGTSFDSFIKELTPYIQEDIESAWDKAVRSYKLDRPEKETPECDPKKSEYIYIYPAIANPERIAGIRKTHLIKWIRMQINAMFWTVHRSWIEYFESGKNLAQFMSVIFINWRPGTLPEDFLLEHGVLLKPGKAARIISGKEESLEVFAGYLQDAMYELSPEGMDVLVSEFPSTVYIRETSEHVASCMKPDEAEDYECHEDYFHLYDRIKDCSIAYILEEDDYGDEILVARALLWDNVHNEDNGKVIKIMDRIYFASNRHLVAMQRWARKNGYWYKVQQALNVNNYYPPEGSEEPLELPNLWVDAGKKFEERQYRFVPYIDTFKYVKMRESIMRTSYMSGYQALTDTQGDGDWLTWGTHERCCKCEDYLDKNHFSYDGCGYCDYCRDQRFVQCEKCGDWFKDDEDIHCEVVNGEDKWLCSNCLQQYDYCEYSEEYYSPDKMKQVITSAGVTKYISIEYLESSEDFFKCESCGNWYHEDCLHETLQGFYCDDCMEYFEECPCCHQLSDKRQVYNHNLRDWVCPDCVDESEIHPESKAMEEDSPKQYDLFPHSSSDGPLRLVYSVVE